jgi:predicted metal-binding protein
LGREGFDGLMSKLARLRGDAKELCELAIKNGANHAKVIRSEQVVVDERVLLKCMYPPCKWYGQCLMCPPYTPSPQKFSIYLKKYRYAVIIQFEFPYPEELAKKIRDGNDVLPSLFKEIDYRDESFNVAWKELHRLVSTIEREAFKRGYYFATGLVGASCILCEKCDPNMPCRHPYEARPSMESVGIDVYATTKKVGLDFMFSPRDRITLTGLVLLD